MDVKINLRIITKNHAVDLKIGSPLKSILEPTHEFIPTALELKFIFLGYVQWNMDPMQARGGGGSYEYPGTVYLLTRILKI